MTLRKVHGGEKESRRHDDLLWSFIHCSKDKLMVVVLRDIIIRSLQSFMLDGVWCPTSRLFDDDYLIFLVAI